MYIEKDILVYEAKKAQEELQSYIEIVAHLQKQEERMLTNVSFIFSELIEVIQNG